MSEQRPQKSNKLFWVAIGCGALVLVGIPIIGILAAIAIPAFLTYTKKSKAVEADMVVRQIGENIRAHYAENCKFPEDLPPSADVDSCCGGNHCVQSVGTWPQAYQDVVASAKYFSYTARLIDDNAFEVVATTDFVCGGPQHQTILVIEGGDDCMPLMGPVTYADEMQ